MCGIVGYKFAGERKAAAVPFIEALLIQSQMRGRHATGIAFVQDETHDEEFVRSQIGLVKQPVPAEVFIKTNEWQNIMHEGLPPAAAILHTRYSTSGDWEKNENNQPLVLGEVALVHNGLVSMAERQVFNQQYGVDCATENDSEILLRKIVGRTEPLMRDRIASAMTEVAFIEHPIHACGLLTKGAELFYWRDNIRPLYAFRVEQPFVLEGFSSTLDIVIRAAWRVGVLVEVQICTPGQIYYDIAPVVR
jgi:glutamine phosphoribosylpyrophosphate amidotransferase